MRAFLELAHVRSSPATSISSTLVAQRLPTRSFQAPHIIIIMPSHQVPTILLGTSSFGPTPLYTHHTVASQSALLSTFHAHGQRRIDTARVYGITNEFGLGGTERVLKDVGVTGEEGERKGWVVDTKIVMSSLGGMSIRESLQASLKDLGVDKVNICYVHGPDRTTPNENTIREMDVLFKEGKFAKFGLSNYPSSKVSAFLSLCAQHDLNPPTIYQGDYSILSRLDDPDLFPLLREHNIAFYASAPLAKGFAAGKGAASLKCLEEEARDNAGGRFHPESRKVRVYQGMWFEERIFRAIQHLNGLLPKGENPLALSLRWLSHHSLLDARYGDGIILGASSPEQLESSLRALEGGGLSEEDQQGMEEVRQIVESPTYNSWFGDTPQMP